MMAKLFLAVIITSLELAATAPMTSELKQLTPEEGLLYITILIFTIKFFPFSSKAACMD